MSKPRSGNLLEVGNGDLGYQWAACVLVSLEKYIVWSDGEVLGEFFKSSLNFTIIFQGYDAIMQPRLFRDVDFSVVGSTRFKYRLNVAKSIHVMLANFSWKQCNSGSLFFPSYPFFCQGFYFFKIPYVLM